jgi:hypothetical protein
VQSLLTADSKEIVCQSLVHPLNSMPVHAGLLPLDAPMPEDEEIDNLGIEDNLIRELARSLRPQHRKYQAR